MDEEEDREEAKVKKRVPGQKKKGRSGGLFGGGRRLTITESRGESRRNGRGWEKIWQKVGRRIEK